MRDQPLSLEQAARWLDCPPDDVREFLSSGRLRPYGVAAADTEAISLNSVVVLAESLPAERGIFRVRDMPGSGDHGGSGGYSPRPQGGRPQGERPGFVVERRPTTRRI